MRTAHPTMILISLNLLTFGAEGNAAYLTKIYLTFRGYAVFDPWASAAGMLQSSLQGRIHGGPRIECHEALMFK